MTKKQDLVYFKKILEAGSISVAADKLNISQPALSAFLRKKESELGSVILDRSSQPVKLTPAGAAYMTYLEEAAMLDRKLNQKLADISQLKSGSLIIGGASFFNVSYVPEAACKFLEMYPGISLEIIDGKVPDLQLMSQQGEIDLFISPEMSNTDNIQYEEFLSEKIFLSVPLDWEVNQRLKHKQISYYDALNLQEEKLPKLTGDELAMLCNETFVLLNQDQYMGKAMNKAFEAAGCKAAHIIKAGQSMTSFALTSAGAGASLITESSLRHTDIRRPVLYMLEIGPRQRQMYVAYHKGRFLSKAAAEFIKILKDINKREA